MRVSLISLSSIHQKAYVRLLGGHEAACDDPTRSVRQSPVSDLHPPLLPFGPIGFHSHRATSRSGGIATLHNQQLRLQPKSQDSSPRSRSSSISSSDEAVGTVVEVRPARGWSGTRGSAIDTDDLHQRAPSPGAAVSIGAWGVPAPSPPTSSGQPSTSHVSSAALGRAGPAGAEGSATTGGAPATAATRLGRVIKKPVRLEEQHPGRQTLAGRNGRADAPARLAARAAMAALSGAVGEPAVPVLASANEKVGGQESGWSSATGEGTTVAPGAGGAERCVARLGTAASNDDSVHGVGASNRSLLSRAGSSNGSDSAAASKLLSSAGVAVSSSTGGSVLRMALPAEGRTAGLPQTGGDVDGDVSARVGSGDPSRRPRYTVRERDRLVVPDPPPERPLRALGAVLDEAVREYKRAYDNVRGRHSGNCWINRNPA